MEYATQLSYGLHTSIYIGVSAEIALRTFKEVAVHAKSIVRACIRGYAHFRNGPFCSSSGQQRKAALSASAASASAYAAIDRPETCSTHERSGADFGTTEAGPGLYLRSTMTGSRRCSSSPFPILSGGR